MQKIGLFVVFFISTVLFLTACSVEPTEDISLKYKIELFTQESGYDEEVGAACRALPQKKQDIKAPQIRVVPKGMKIDDPEEVAMFMFMSSRKYQDKVFEIHQGLVSKQYQGQGLGPKIRQVCFKLMKEKFGDHIGFTSRVRAGNYASISYNLKQKMIPFINHEGDWGFFDSHETFEIINQERLKKEASELEKSKRGALKRGAILRDSELPPTILGKKISDFISPKYGTKKEITQTIELNIKRQYEEEFSKNLQVDKRPSTADKYYKRIVKLACDNGINLNEDQCKK